MAVDRCVTGWRDGDSRIASVSVHGIALPDDGAFVLRALESADVVGEAGGDFVGAIAGDEDDLADLVVRVEDVEDREEVGGGHGWTEFYADRVGDAGEEVCMCVRELAGAVADPDHVR